jgi:hypothetical protein
MARPAPILHAPAFANPNSHLPSLRRPSGQPRLRGGHDAAPPPPAVGKSEMDGITHKIIEFCSLSASEDSPITRSKSFDPDRPSGFKKLLTDKCRECSKKTGIDGPNRAAKEELLEQMVAVFHSPFLVRKIDDDCLNALVKMTLANISREIPPIRVVSATFLFDRTEQFADAAWPTLSLVYKVLYFVVVSTYIQQSLLALHFTQPTIAVIFRCLLSPDVHERQQTKQCLFTLACRLHDCADFLLDLISHAFSDALSDEPISLGLPQIIELFAGLVQSVPSLVTNPFDSFLLHHLMPLHLSSELQLYSQPLISCIVILLERNRYNIDKCLMYLLNHFPCASQRKQTLFIVELSSIIDRYWEWMSPMASRYVFERMSSLWPSSCGEISEKSLGLLFTDGFVKLLKQYYTLFTPMLIERATKVSISHWSDGSIFSALALLQHLAQIDPINFPKMKYEIPLCDRDRRLEVWARLSCGVVQSPPASSRETLPVPKLQKKVSESRRSNSGRGPTLPVLDAKRKSSAPRSTKG